MTERIAEDFDHLASTAEALGLLKKEGGLHMFLIRPDCSVIIDPLNLQKPVNGNPLRLRQWVSVNEQLALVSGWRADEDLYRAGICRYEGNGREGKIVYVEGVRIDNGNFRLMPATQQGFDLIMRNFGATTKVPFSYFA